MYKKYDWLARGTYPVSHSHLAVLLCALPVGSGSLITIAVAQDTSARIMIVISCIASNHAAHHGHIIKLTTVNADDTLSQSFLSDSSRH